MLSTLLAATLSLMTMLCCLANADACDELGCQALTTVPAQVVDRSFATGKQPQLPLLAEASDEASVRQRDLRKLEPETPAFWMQFRSYAYRQLPQHKKENFQAVWVAMPLETSDGTVPSLGLVGSWW